MSWTSYIQQLEKYYKTDHFFISVLSGTGNIKDKADGVYRGQCQIEVNFQNVLYLLRGLDAEVLWVGVLWDSVQLHPSISVPMHPKWQPFSFGKKLGKMGSTGFSFHTHILLGSYLCY